MDVDIYLDHANFDIDGLHGHKYCTRQNYAAISSWVETNTGAVFIDIANGADCVGILVLLYGCSSIEYPTLACKYNLDECALRFATVLFPGYSGCNLSLW